MSIQFSMDAAAAVNGAMLTENHLRIAWGLTTAEARLAIRLATGKSLRSGAEALDITYETAPAGSKLSSGRPGRTVRASSSR